MVEYPSGVGKAGRLRARSKLPCSRLAPTPEEALAGIRELVSDCVEDMRANGEEPPQPFADRGYSGKFMVRVPPETHRALALRAAEEGVSMNRLVGARLAGQRK